MFNKTNCPDVKSLSVQIRVLFDTDFTMEYY